MRANTFILDPAAPADHPLYLCAEGPYWFVPNPAFARILLNNRRRIEISSRGREVLIPVIRETMGKSFLEAALLAEHLFSALELPVPPPYQGRNGVATGTLNELWLHLTDHCNLRCRHCLFGDRLDKGRHLPVAVAKRLVREARELGCTLLCCTGGEPLLYPGFIDLLTWVQEHTRMRLAILTNGLLLRHHLRRFLELDRERLHFQVSLEGVEPVNNAIRGAGSFAAAVAGIRALRDQGFSVSVATTINDTTMDGLGACFPLLAELGVALVHWQYHFQRGHGRHQQVAVRKFCRRLPDILAQAAKAGITIDNVEAIRSQVFTPAGTRFDLGNGGIQSLAVGPDGMVYPTPATVGIPWLQAGQSGRGLAVLWQESPVLQRIASCSLLDESSMAADPFRFLVGGGDLDHCLTGWDEQGNPLLRPDPYAPIARHLVRFLIREAAAGLPSVREPGLRLRVGDMINHCHVREGINLTHCNCLLSMGPGTRGLVRNFYGDRAGEPDTTILNPIQYPEKDLALIPEEARGRMYGCGSPLEEAALTGGETLVDLGCGTGVECFLGARQVGPGGRVYGIDMTRRMLAIAKRARPEVGRRLGYDNLTFREGLLEDIPLEAAVADVVISNCVINLSQDKRRVFAEILRILKPGGRLVIADVVTEEEPGLAIRADSQLSGECIGGAMVQSYLLALLADMGFVRITLVHRFPYRVVRGHAFFSLTVRAWKPPVQADANSRRYMYAGPHRGLVAGTCYLQRGLPVETRALAGLTPGQLAEQGIFLFDDTGGRITNVKAGGGCRCGLEPEAEAAEQGSAQGAGQTVPVAPTGCLICGAPLRYLQHQEEKACARCGVVGMANSVCVHGHFVCDGCHVRSPREVISAVCRASRATDMITLMQEIRRADVFPLHGPEHHILVPAVILTTYRNLGGRVDEGLLSQAIERGARVPGGACGFMGICGAATGVGIAFSLLLKATPLTPRPRQQIQRLVARILEDISGHRAGRCCQRECFLALVRVAALSPELLDIPLQAATRPVCQQWHHNRECIRKGCPFYAPATGASCRQQRFVFPQVGRN